MGVSMQSVAGRYGGTASDSSAWISDTSVLCGVVGSVSRSLSVLVTAGGQAGSLSDALSFSELSMSSATPANMVGRGGTVVTSLGAGLGGGDVSSAVRLGQTTVEGSRWVSDTSVVCQAAAGVGSSLHVLVTVGV
eukprot:1552533-Rhodomonas_salina.1